LPFYIHFSPIVLLPTWTTDPTQSGPLLTVTLETLLRYLSWIPIGYVLETSVIEILVLKFFPFALFQNIALQVRVGDECEPPDFASIIQTCFILTFLFL
jgi:hypothetical protein